MRPPRRRLSPSRPRRRDPPIRGAPPPALLAEREPTEALCAPAERPLRRALPPAARVADTLEATRPATAPAAMPVAMGADAA